MYTYKIAKLHANLPNGRILNVQNALTVMDTSRGNITFSFWNMTFIQFDVNLETRIILVDKKRTCSKRVSYML